MGTEATNSSVAEPKIIEFSSHEIIDVCRNRREFASNEPETSFPDKISHLQTQIQSSSTNHTLSILLDGTRKEITVKNMGNNIYDNILNALLKLANKQENVSTNSTTAAHPSIQQQPVQSKSTVSSDNLAQASKQDGENPVRTCCCMALIQWFFDGIIGLICMIARGAYSVYEAISSNLSTCSFFGKPERGKLAEASRQSAHNI